METELKALREQLRPHFLFNTMNTIAVLVREGKNDEAVNLIARLSTLLRMSLDNTRVHEVTLRQEMDFLERYIDIQKARFSDRLQVDINIEPGAMEARIPNLILQPIVEEELPGAPTALGVPLRTAPFTDFLAERVSSGAHYLTGITPARLSVSETTTALDIVQALSPGYNIRAASPSAVSCVRLCN